MPILDTLLVFLAIGVVVALAAGLSDVLSGHVAPRLTPHLRAQLDRPDAPRVRALARALLAPFGLEGAPTSSRVRPPRPSAPSVPPVARGLGAGTVVQPSLFPLPVRTRTADGASLGAPARSTRAA